MKKLILLFLIFLTCCAPMAAQKPTATPTSPDLDAFKTSEQCPGLCWLGMHPGKTTRQQAIDIFTKTPGNANMHLTSGSLEGEWFTDKEKVLKAFVAIHFSGELV